MLALLVLPVLPVFLVLLQLLLLPLPALLLAVLGAAPLLRLLLLPLPALLLAVLGPAPLLRLLGAQYGQQRLTSGEFMITSRIARPRAGMAQVMVHSDFCPIRLDGWVFVMHRWP